MHVTRFIDIINLLLTQRKAKRGDSIVIAIYDIDGKLKPFVTKKTANHKVVEIDSYTSIKNILKNDLNKYYQVLINTDRLDKEEINNITMLLDTPKKQVKVLLYELKNGIPTLINTKLNTTDKTQEISKKDDLTINKFKPINNVFARKYEHICIGVSTGGPATLEIVIPQFPKDIDASIVVIQHILRGNHIYNLCDRLNKISQIEVKVAEDGEVLRNGVAYFPPPGLHAYYKRHANNEVSIHLTDTYPKEGKSEILKPGYKFVHVPSIDIGMESATDIYGDKMVGVILTGMGSDGALALKYARDKGVHTLSESKETSVIYGMPRAAYENGGSMEVLKHYLIPNRILEIINYKPKIKI